MTTVEISWQERERLVEGLRMMNVRHVGAASWGTYEKERLLRDAADYIEALDDLRMRLEEALNPEPFHDSHIEGAR